MNDRFTAAAILKAAKHGLNAIANNPNATVSPTSTDDNSKGYSAKGGSTWTQIDGENVITYNCVDDTKDAAVWVNTSSMYIFDDWSSFVSAISIDDTTYIGKYVVVLNASGGVTEGITYTAPTAIASPITDTNSATYKVNVQGTNWSVTCKKHDAEVIAETTDIVGEIKEYSGFTCPNGYLWARGQAVPRATYVNLMKASTIEFTNVSMTSGSAIITVNDTSNLCAGQPVEGVGIVIGALILSVTDATHFTTTSNATQTTSTGTVKIFPYGNGDGTTTFNVVNKVGRVGIGAGKATFKSTFLPSAVSVASNNIIVTYNNSLYTGTAVVYSTTGTAIGGLTNGSTYYIIRDSANLIRLSTNRSGAVAGTVIDLTSQGTGIHTLTINYSKRVAGEVLGEEEHTDTQGEMPNHRHDTWDNYGTQYSAGTWTDISSADEPEHTEYTGYTGGSQAHNNIQPTIVTNFIVKY